MRCYHVGSEGCVSMLVMKGGSAPTLGLRAGCGHVGFLVSRVSVLFLGCAFVCWLLRGMCAYAGSAGCVSMRVLRSACARVGF